MMKNLISFFSLAFIVIAPFILSAQNEDAEGCKDHPLFNRMTNFYIMSCLSRDFDGYNFRIENSTEDDAKRESVEGKYYEYGYHVNDGVTEPSALQIFRNFENAFKQAGFVTMGKVIESGNSYSFICAKAKKGNSEVWVNVETSGSEYNLIIVERQIMQQVIQANDMFLALNKDGFIALDILFDTGKSTIKSESQPIIDQMFELLKNNPELKISIEGHTDNVGNPNSNKTLSEARAKAVMDALIAKGIAKERMNSLGWGQEKPVADNRTDEGKAKNRRVEIVKK